MSGILKDQIMIYHSVIQLTSIILFSCVLGPSGFNSRKTRRAGYHPSHTDSDYSTRTILVFRMNFYLTILRAGKKVNNFRDHVLMARN